MKEKFLIFEDEKINFKKTINILLLVMVFSGFFGFLYETIFYRIDLGYFVKRGSTFGPWIPIYAVGGLLIVSLSYRFRNNPFKVFLINCVITGVLEYFVGYILYKFLNLRLWDYNTEIWNFGNINGYICFRSIAFFGISSLILIYGLVPILKKISGSISEKVMSIISNSLFGLFALDIIIYIIYSIL